MDKNQVQKKIVDLGWWYQHFELPNGINTGIDSGVGFNAESRWKIIESYVPKDLTDKTCLDLGGNAGYFSIQMKLRGAKRCVLVDTYDQFLAQAKFASEQFGVQLELINDDAHTFCLTCEERFDYVMFLGLFYHLKYPGIVLDRLAEMTKKRIFIQSGLIGSETTNFTEKQNYEVKKDDSLLMEPSFPKMTFIENLYNNDPTNWWFPNRAALISMVKSSGLKIISNHHPEFIIAEPENYFGKSVYKKLVFPKFGKRDGTIFPGPQKFDSKVIKRLQEEKKLIV